MRLTVRMFDEASVLSGGTLGVASEVYAGGSDWHMGFTNGREDDDG